MKNFRDIRVKYNHPAIPPLGIRMDIVYTVGYLIDTYDLGNSIKILFTPIETTWDELESKNNKKTKIKEVEKETEDTDVNER